MIFNLQIFQDDDTENGQLIGEYTDVDVRWESYGGQCAIATYEGKIIAQLATFDDYPIEILGDHIYISGVVDREAKEPLSEYGYWILKR